MAPGVLVDSASNDRYAAFKVTQMSASPMTTVGRTHAWMDGMGPPLGTAIAWGPGKEMGCWLTLGVIWQRPIKSEGAQEVFCTPGKRGHRRKELGGPR